MARVLEMTVRDIMETEVTTVSPETPVRELTRLLSDQGISGAPVVTASGAVVGVVSSTDVVRLAAEESDLPTSGGRWGSAGADDWEHELGLEEAGDVRDTSAGFFLPEDSPSFAPGWSEELGEATFDECTVADIMTPVSFAMPPTASVKDLADFLLRGRIHRAVVIEEDHLVGIVTTMDVLRAVAEGQL
ncbi:MAG TPA: CBS domain-containing protein [Longimicrobiales bacterium]|nr:CBS domain-containing protein [Longimicrobiales bacterium]